MTSVFTMLIEYTHKMHTCFLKVCEIICPVSHSIHFPYEKTIHGLVPASSIVRGESEKVLSVYK